MEGIREHLRPYCSDTGRPEIDSGLMIRMLIIGYCSIRQERRLWVEVHLDLPIAGIADSGLEGAVPDLYHLLKEPGRPLPRLRPATHLSEMTVVRCMHDCPVGGGLAVDAIPIRADVHRQRSVPVEKFAA